MGQHTLVSIPLDLADRIEEDPNFGKNLIRGIMRRGNPNVTEKLHEVHGVSLGRQFHSSDTFLVFINDGVIERLSIEEQILLEDELRRIRRKEIARKK